MQNRESIHHIHLIGIGGAGLSAIATVLLQQGYTVSGSDLRPSPVTERLSRLGATVHIGHDAANLGAAGTVIVSSAVPEDNPEVKEARRRGISLVKRAEWLGRMMSGKRGVAVAGTHGKTTTTAMIALILRDAGLDPTFIVGGDIPQLGTNAAAGAGNAFVIEADEYDHTFLGLRPEIAVITVVEWDHPDCYPTPASLVEAFRQFVELVPPEGLIIGCGDEPGGATSIVTASDTAAKRQEATTLRRYDASLTTYGLDSSNDWRAVELRPNGRGGYDFSVDRAGKRLKKVSLAVPGTHNVKNALAALVAADALNVSLEQAKTTLAGFAGVGRRFEIKGEAQGILVVDDYAHHPTEIRATLAGARARYPDRPIWALFQPHTYSRTRALLKDFAAAFDDADHVIIVDVFPAREVDNGSVHSRDIVAQMHHRDAHYIGELDAAADFLVEKLSAGDLLITMGAGDSHRVGEIVLEKIQRRNYTL